MPVPEYVPSANDTGGYYAEVTVGLVGPEAPEMMVPALYKRAATAPATVAEDITAPKASALPISQPQLGKSDGVVTGLFATRLRRLLPRCPPLQSCPVRMALAGFAR